jgi:hypothetical protein
MAARPWPGLHQRGGVAGGLVLLTHSVGCWRRCCYCCAGQGSVCLWPAAKAASQWQASSSCLWGGSVDTSVGVWCCGWFTHCAGVMFACRRCTCTQYGGMPRVLRCIQPMPHAEHSLQLCLLQVPAVMTQGPVCPAGLFQLTACRCPTWPTPAQAHPGPPVVCLLVFVTHVGRRNAQV